MPETGKHRLSVLAVDLGGTKTITAIVSVDGQVIAKERSLTLADEGPSSVINRLLEAIDHLLSSKSMDSSQLGCISLAVAGGIDIERGLVTSSPHLPGWHDVPLRDMLKNKYHVATFLLNDASATALGEYRFGAGRGVNNLVLLTIGTGIGGGIVINGKLYNGPSGSAGELGHMTVDINGPECVCGNIGCLETLVSGPVMAGEAVKQINQGASSSLVEMVAGRIEDITAEDIGAAARAGDSLSLKIITEAATYLGIGLVNVVNIFNPEMIILAGGVAELGDLLLDPAWRVVKERAFPVSTQVVRIVTAELGDEAAVRGAAVFALEQEG